MLSHCQDNANGVRFRVKIIQFVFRPQEKKQFVIAVFTTRC